MRTCRISQKYTIVSYMLKLSKRWWYWRYEASLMQMLWLLCWIHTFIEFHGLEISLLGETMIKSRTVHGRLYARSDTFRHHKYTSPQYTSLRQPSELLSRLDSFKLHAALATSSFLDQLKRQMPTILRWPTGRGRLEGRNCSASFVQLSLGCSCYLSAQM